MAEVKNKKNVKKISKIIIAINKNDILSKTCFILKIYIILYISACKFNICDSRMEIIIPQNTQILLFVISSLMNFSTSSFNLLFCKIFSLSKKSKIALKSEKLQL